MITTQQIVGIWLIFLGGLLSGMLVASLLADSRENKIKKLIKYGILEYFIQKNAGKQIGPEIVTPLNIPRLDPRTRFKVRPERAAPTTPIEDVIKHYEPKDIRAALSRLQARVGGKFTKTGEQS